MLSQLLAETIWISHVIFSTQFQVQPSAIRSTQDSFEVYHIFFKDFHWILFIKKNTAVFIKNTELKAKIGLLKKLE